ncbi:TonB-dependent receptor [Gammaproteobacteria bacterium]|nr:TonB-dependent receptor [Gammaproteobacteria bacterium]
MQQNKGIKPERGKRLLKGVSAAVVALSSLAYQGQALAQNESAIEEIVVSARFREENLQDTPLAITAVSGDALEMRGLTDVTQLDDFSPNTVIAPLGAGWGSTAAAFIRGIGLGDNSLSFEPGVPIYIDDVYYGRPQGAILDLLDLERVEILRGPQGTLFGRNAIGGAVRLVSKKPRGEETGSFEVITGTDDRLDLRGSFDTTLIEDTLFARFSASSKQRDGYFDILDFECVNGAGSLGAGGPGAPAFGFNNGIALGSELGSTETRASDCVVDTLGNDNVQSGRAAFSWLASDSLEVNFNYDITHMRQKGPADNYTIMNGDFVLWDIWNNTVSEPVFGAGIRWDDRFLTDSDFTGYHRYADPLTNRRWENVNDLDHSGYSAVVEWDIADNLHLKSVTAGRDLVNTYGRDSDGSPLPINHTWDTAKHEQFTQEFQLTGLSLNESLDWAVGAFWYNATDSNANIGTLAPGPISSLDGFDKQDSENWAVFAHGTYAIDERLNVTAGIRYTDDRKEASIYRFDFLSNTVTIPNAEVVVEADQWSPKLGVDYRWNDDLMTYFQWSTGFRGGGFVPRPQNAFQVQSFDVEELESYEVGVKADLLDGMMRTNLAVFVSEYTDQQAPDQRCAPCDPADGGPVPFFATGNAGTADIWGIELEVQAQPTDNLSIEAALGYQRYHRHPTAAQIAAGAFCERDSRGDLCTAPRMPERTLSLGVEYLIPLNNGSALTLRGDAKYQSEINFNTDPDFGFQEGYTLVNAKLVWMSPDETWQAALFGENLTDKTYYHGKLSLVGNLGREQGNPARLRQWGFSLKRQF